MDDKKEEECHDDDVDVYREEQPEIFSENKMPSVDRFRDDCVYGFFIELIIYESYPDEEGDEEPEEVDRGNPKVFDDAVFGGDCEFPNDSRECHQQQRKDQKDIQNPVSDGFFEGVEGYSDNLIHLLKLYLLDVPPRVFGG